MHCANTATYRGGESSSELLTRAPQPLPQNPRIAPLPINRKPRDELPLSHASIGTIGEAFKCNQVQQLQRVLPKAAEGFNPKSKEVLALTLGIGAVFASLVAFPDSQSMPWHTRNLLPVGRSERVNSRKIGEPGFVKKHNLQVGDQGLVSLRRHVHDAGIRPCISCQTILGTVMALIYGSPKERLAIQMVFVPDSAMAEHTSSW